MYRITNVDVINYRKKRFSTFVISGYDEQGNRVREEDKDFKPYFYVEEDYAIPEFKFDDDANDYACSINSLDAIHNISAAPNHLITGHKMKKVEIKNLNYFETLKNRFDGSCERHINFVNRYMIDKSIVLSKERNTMHIDIECDDSYDATNAPAPVTCATVECDKCNKRETFIWRSDLTDERVYKDVFLGKHGKEREYNRSISVTYFNGKKEVTDIILTEVHEFDNEVSFSNAVLDWIVEHDPDVISQFTEDGNEFDLYYFLRRMKSLGIDFRLISPYNYVELYTNKKGKRVLNIACRDHINVISTYQYVVYSKPTYGYSLDSLAYEENLPRKLPLSETPGIIWRTDKDKLIEYNVIDEYVAKKIVQKRMLDKYLFNYQRFIPIKLRDCTSGARLITDYILYKFHDKCVFPSSNYSSDGEDFSGAFVYADTCPRCKKKYDVDTVIRYDRVCLKCRVELQPRASVIKNLIVIDARNMYPNLYRMANVSPETIDANGDIVVDDVRFTSSKKGIFPQVLEEIIQAIYEYEAMIETYVDTSGRVTDQEAFDMYSELRRTFKRFLNHFYGVTGYPGFMLHDVRVAKSITSLGRAQTKWMIQVIKINFPKYEVVYGHTDSVFVLLPDDYTKEQCIDACKNIAKTVNNSFGDFCKKFNVSENKYLKVRDDIAYRGFMIAGVRNKYCGHVIYDKGKFVDYFNVKGFEQVKEDMPPFFADIQEKILKAICSMLKEDDLEKVVMELVASVEKERDIRKIGEPKKVKKDYSEYKNKSYVVKAGEAAGLMGKMLVIPLKGGEWVAFKPDGVLPNDLEVDYDVLVRKYIIAKNTQLFKILGFSRLHSLFAAYNKKKRKANQEIIKGLRTQKSISSWIM